MSDGTRNVEAAEQAVSEQNRIRLEKLRQADRRQRAATPTELVRFDQQPPLRARSSPRTIDALEGKDGLHRRPHDVAPRDGQGQLRPPARPRRPDPDLCPPRRCRRGSLQATSRTTTLATSSACQGIGVPARRSGEISVHAQKVTLLTKCAASRCRRSSTASRTPTRATASAIWI